MINIKNNVYQLVSPLLRRSWPLENDKETTLIYTRRYTYYRYKNLERKRVYEKTINDHPITIIINVVFIIYIHVIYVWCFSFSVKVAFNIYTARARMVLEMSASTSCTLFYDRPEVHLTR